MENVYSNYKELNPFFVWSFSKYIFQYQSYSFNYNNEISYKVAWLFAHLNMNNSSMKWSHCISSNFLIIRHEGWRFSFYIWSRPHCFHQHALNGFSFQTCPAIFCSLCWMMTSEVWRAGRSCLIGVSDGLKKDKEWTVGVKAPTCQGRQLLRCFFVGMKLEKLAHSVIACPDKLIMTKLVKTLEMN